jgi:hypothetical protein
MAATAHSRTRCTTYDRIMSNFVYSLFILTLVSCKTTKTLADYGILDKRHVCSKDNYKNGNLILKIKDYVFKFDFTEFENELESYEKESLTEYSKILRNNYLEETSKFELSKINQEYFIKGTEGVGLDESFAINYALDNLYKSGKFYLNDNGNIKCVVYEHWRPHEQGAINSKWIIDKKVVNEIVFGFVN